MEAAKEYDTGTGRTAALPAGQRRGVRAPRPGEQGEDGTAEPEACRGWGACRCGAPLRGAGEEPVLRCLLSRGHGEEHAAPVGPSADGAAEAYVLWRPGAGARACLLASCGRTESGDARYYLDARCVLFRGHPGRCLF